MIINNLKTSSLTDIPITNGTGVVFILTLLRLSEQALVYIKMERTFNLTMSPAKPGYETRSQLLQVIFCALVSRPPADIVVRRFIAILELMADQFVALGS